ncbi:Glutaredoxin domain-containing cysteine-rich protein [Oopsacas minuta]|uniref:Glutaredoxin domain-containing cysteine-rich protein n=1 Tax=Oopsacas minuta TaxID=111878 RepID=A0AAV7JX03_9METZ|nr:Glutaredoxin domain-containing cysteine-rich protein [Oopsacas minuta]
MASRRQFTPDSDSPPDYLKKPGSLKIDGVTGKIQKGDDIRGMRNIAKDSIAKFEGLKKQSETRTDPLHDFHEKGKVVIYTTSLSTIRQTFNNCRRVKAIFEGHRCKVFEKDIALNKHYISELEKRLEGEVTVPVVFINGDIVGDAEMVIEMNETGELKRLITNYERSDLTCLCQLCNATGFVLCSLCNGSKNGVRNDFTDEFKALKCTSCNEIGLVPCPRCSASE